MLVTAGLVAITNYQPSSPQSTEQSLIVQKRPFTITINVVGTLTSAESVVITAPFDGSVEAINFRYGDLVKAGQQLVAMDTFDISQHRNDAQANYLKATQAARDMASWPNGPEVSRARRALTSAELQLKETERKTQETKELLARGLVARAEYDGLRQQQRTEELALQAAQDDLATARQKGDSASLEVANTELANAKAKLSDVTQQLAGATVVAPIAGIVIRPPIEKSGSEQGEIHAGERLTRGQLIGSIGKAGRLAVTLRLDEADAVRLHGGEAVVVTGPGFGGIAFHGHLVNVAGEATPKAGAGATFGAQAVLDPLTEAQTQNIRIGMTADVAITIYEATAAIVVPPQSVEGAASAAAVRIKDGQTGRIRRAQVVVGAAAPDGVEILSGLRPGDQIVWSTANVTEAGSP